MNKKTLDIVVPIYNESDSISLFFRRISEVNEKISNSLELHTKIIFVNDGSNDGSAEIVNELSSKYPELTVTLITLVKNFGSQAAIVAGLNHSTASKTIIMSVDLQDPPELIFDMLKEIDAGFKVVYGSKEDNLDSFVNRLTSRIYGLLFMPKDDEGRRYPTGSFLAIDEQTRLILNKLSHIDAPIYEKLIWLTPKHKMLNYIREPRLNGNSKWNLTKRLQAGISTLMRKGLLLKKLGIGIIAIELLASLFLLFYTIYSKISGGTQPGWLSIITIITFYFTLQSVLLLILIEFASRSEKSQFPWYLESNFK